MQLQPGTLLKAGSYRIIRTLGRGGFGITYLAEQVMVRRQVCVKEFFPKDYYKRDGDTRNITLSSDGFGQMMDKFKTKFLKEAQIIAGLDHPNIIRIHDVFEENGTAYYVMEYIEGESLQSIVSRRGALGRDEAVGYIEQLAAALGYIHSHDIAHLDVKPGNVMVRSKDDRALLIDFGLSKHYDSEGMQTSSTPLGISHGFAPIEQYQVGGVSTFSPRTDIYSMGATLYYLAMGKVPPAAANVGEDGLDELPSHFGAGVCTAIERSMQYRRKDRPASAEEFMSLVRGGGQTTFVDGPKRDEVQRREPQRDSRPEPRPSKPEGDKPKKSKWWLWLLLAVVGVICGIALIGGDEENLSTADMYYGNPTEETTEPVDSVAVDSPVLEPTPEPEQKPEDKPEPTPEPDILPDPILTLKSKSSVTLDADGDSGKITYTLTNPRDDMRLSVTSNVNWISVSRSGSTISYSTTANNGENSRSGKITVKYGDQSFEVLISQAGKPKPEIPPEQQKTQAQVVTDVLNIVSNDQKIETNIVFADDADEFDDFEMIIEEKEEEIVEEEIFITVEDMPTFRGGGLPEFRTWVQQNIKYPQIALENGIQGLVVVTFVVDKDGKLTNFKVLQSPDKTLSDATIDVLKKANEIQDGWKPGKQRGKPVRVSFSMPVNFKLTSHSKRGK